MLKFPVIFDTKMHKLMDSQNGKSHSFLLASNLSLLSVVYIASLEWIAKSILGIQRTRRKPSYLLGFMLKLQFCFHDGLVGG